ncbi:MAG: N-acetyltransferase [Myxococcota bacterium]|jgi:putative acetyltransferase|nr:N-acetyltransferase [Myxococcota bacterium]
MNVVVRPEQPGDLAAIRDVNLAGFPGEAEADLVDALRANGKAMLSLVALQGDRIVGHILFSPVTIGSSDAGCRVLGLAPMAVLPDSQRQGIGSMLVETGLAHGRRSGVDCVVVLGHPDYYLRFGFEPASRFDIGCEYDVPDENFLVVELTHGSLDRVSGIARYPPEFAAL